jgi:hypothetical protein
MKVGYDVLKCLRRTKKLNDMKIGDCICADEASCSLFASSGSGFTTSIGDYYSLPTTSTSRPDIASPKASVTFCGVCVGRFKNISPTPLSHTHAPSINVYLCITKTTLLACVVVHTNSISFNYRYQSLVYCIASFLRSRHWIANSGIQRMVHVTDRDDVGQPA